MSANFLDELIIYVKAGAGGSGCVSFCREKYIPKGGPDGGNGGDGGSVILKSDSKVLSLGHLVSDKVYSAQKGRTGQGRQKTGKTGKSITLKVPLGTQLFDTTTQELLYDFTRESQFILAEGSKGGKGNTFFKNSKRQTPRQAQPGMPTYEKSFLLSLKLIADAGFVGLPNAGKSTLLKALTNAKPKIAEYAFTTLTPNLGYIHYDEIDKILIADIPGIIEGASKGSGLGLSFLKHIERVYLLVFVLDINTATVKDELKLLREELKYYNEKLNQKPYIIAMNKVDCITDKEFLRSWMLNTGEDPQNIVLTSALKGDGLDKLKQKIYKMV